MKTIYLKRFGSLMFSFLSSPNRGLEMKCMVKFLLIYISLFIISSCDVYEVDDTGANTGEVAKEVEAYGDIIYDAGSEEEPNAIDGANEKNSTNFKYFQINDEEFAVTYFREELLESCSLLLKKITVSTISLINNESQLMRIMFYVYDKDHLTCEVDSSNSTTGSNQGRLFEAMVPFIKGCSGFDSSKFSCIERQGTDTIIGVHLLYNENQYSLQELDPISGALIKKIDYFRLRLRFSTALSYKTGTAEAK
jgi:hypothetical protein